jgi:hypothetical protein
MDEKRMVVCFNEWMRRYTEEPERFAHDARTIQTFLMEDALGGTEPSYGQNSAAYLFQIDRELPQ